MTTSSTYDVTQDSIDQYGRINGDNDIIHYDAEYAARRGFRGTLAHGLMVMAYASELAARQHGAEFHRNGQMSVVWTAPVCPGDHLVVELDGADVKATVNEGETVLVGTVGLATASN
jgi:acyl dehydratase